jgi:general secretion pathway protein J
MRRLPSGQGGLTLLELLVAITLLALLLVVLFGGLFLASRSWDAGSRRAEAGDEIRLVNRIVQRMLQQIVPVIAQDSSGAHLAFSGEPHAVTFTAPLPAQLGPGGLYVISLEFVPDRAGLSLRMSYRIYRPDSGSAQEAATRILAEGIDKGAFSYYGSPDGQRPPTWVEHWDSALRMPQLVRLAVAAPDRMWPVLTAEIKNNTYSAFTSAFPSNSPLPQL